MTVATPESAGTDVAAYDPDIASVGLEDVGVGDVVIPRLRIVHKEGVFEDNLSKARFSSIQVILLGLVKQRIMWDSKIDDKDKPQCKSADFEHGFPQVRKDIPIAKQFPWAKSNFDEVNFPLGSGINGLQTLPCASCVFKEWDKGDWKNPPCNEQHTFPLLYSPDGVSWTAALFTVAKTGIKPSRQYISSFAQSKTPMFTAITELTLTQASRGDNEYSIPGFRKIGPTSRDSWEDYANQYRSIREFIHQAPRPLEDVTGSPDVPVSDNTNTAPSPAAPVAPVAAEPAPAVAAVPVVPEQVAVPVAAPVAAAPTPVVAAPAPPVVPAAPAAPVAAAPVAPAPVAAPAPPAAPLAAEAPTVVEDLPF